MIGRRPAGANPRGLGQFLRSRSNPCDRLPCVHRAVGQTKRPILRLPPSQVSTAPDDRRPAGRQSSHRTLIAMATAAPSKGLASGVAPAVCTCYPARMSKPWSNIEPLARELCERGLRGKVPEDELARAVDRYWHCIAAELEAGLIDDRGNRMIPHEHDRDLDAYRDWRRRHPQYEVPPSTPRMLHGAPERKQEQQDG